MSIDWKVNGIQSWHSDPRNIRSISPRKTHLACRRVHEINRQRELMVIYCDRLTDVECAEGGVHARRRTTGVHCGRCERAAHGITVDPAVGSYLYNTHERVGFVSKRAKGEKHHSTDGPTDVPACSRDNRRVAKEQYGSPYLRCALNLGRK